jgi:NAD(P)-dependent dehydrogenase (short-subunit alcohol dehydrogenase family)
VDIEGRVAVVTGGASGIGRSLCHALAEAGAAGVVVADIDGAGAAKVAAEIGSSGRTALAVSADVSAESDVQALVAQAESAFGPVDLYFSNAGVIVAGGVEVADDAWSRTWAINVQSHVYAARALLPGMLARGHGYLVITASAAGLLTQLGSAPYAVTKHAAVAFAEWLSVTYGDRGIRVSCLCPMGVRTAMTQGDELAHRVVRSAGALLEPEEVSDIVVEAIDAERCLILPHPEVLTFFQRKAMDYDRWLAGMRRLQSGQS